jgi:DnaK suppressor protein
MTPTISDTFARQLTALRSSLIERMRAGRGGTRGRADAAAEARAIESDDQARAAEERDLAIALEERESAELVAIDRALQRVADGSYGLCLQCGQPIPAARLHAQPTAERCVACQAMSE